MITFKEYIEAKDKLKKLIENEPIITLRYKCVKTVKLHINENDTVNFKHGNIFKIKWRYSDSNDKNPTPIQLFIDDDEYDVTVETNVLNKWIKTNSYNIIN